MDKILFTVSIVVIVVGYCILLLLLFYPTRLNDSPAMLLTFFFLSLSLFPFSLLLALILFSKWSLMYYTFSVCEFIYSRYNQLQWIHIYGWSPILFNCWEIYFFATEMDVGDWECLNKGHTINHLNMISNEQLHRLWNGPT